MAPGLKNTPQTSESLFSEKPHQPHTDLERLFPHDALEWISEAVLSIKVSLYDGPQENIKENGAAAQQHTPPQDCSSENIQDDAQKQQ